MKRLKKRGELMDTESECRAMDYDEKFFSIYGCYEEDITVDDFDGNEEEYKAFKRDSVRTVRKALGWR